MFTLYIPAAGKHELSLPAPRIDIVVPTNADPLLRLLTPPKCNTTTR
jgi:hypothetical protein